MTYNDIVVKVAEDNGMSPKFVNKVYRAYWKAIRQHIIALPLKNELSDEEFLQLQPNVNIPSIGKLYVTLDRYHRIKNFYKAKSENK